MRWVAFLRNVNQGQRGHPSTADIVDALMAAGLRNVRGFQSNGTFVVEAEETDAALAAAMRSMSATTGRAESAFALPMDEVSALVRGFADDPERIEFSVFRGALPVSAPFRGRACTVLSAGDGWAITRNDDAHVGNATLTLERALGAPATSRGLPTMVRLVAKYDPPA